MSWLIGITVFTVLISWLATGKLITQLSKRNIVDTPNERTLHQGDVPRGGGLVMVAVLLIGFIVVGAVTGRYALFAALFISVLAWASLSWMDDYIDLTPMHRLIAQSVFTALTIAAFGYVQIIQVSTSFVLSISLFGLFATFIGFIWLTNLYNFMDGMDGLAASQTIIASSTLGFWFWQYGDQGLSLICLLLAASSYGFLLWNWHPAKIFMGDVGSITIGAFLATLLLIGVVRYQFPVISFVLLLGVFIADASVTVLIRLVNKEPFWRPHRSHYYQRLAGLGFAHNIIVIALIALMLLCSVIASISIVERDTIWLGAVVEIVVFVVGAAIVVYLESKRTLKQK